MTNKKRRTRNSNNENNSNNNRRRSGIQITTRRGRTRVRTVRPAVLGLKIHSAVSWVVTPCNLVEGYTNVSEERTASIFMVEERAT
jgi:hypothetical protein